jgi:signal transduction histidine kinase
VKRRFGIRLALANSALIVAACALLSWTLVRSDLREIGRGLADRGFALGEHLAREAELPILSGDADTLRRLGQMARAERDVLYTHFADLGGRLESSLGNRPARRARVPETGELPPVDVDAWEFEVPIYTTDARPQREELLAEGAPAAGRRQQIGRVVVGLALGPLRAHGDRVTMTAASLTLIVVMLTVVSAVVLASAITRPLQVLARAADRIAGGELETQVALQSEDEVAAVAESFNAMARSLALSRAALEEHRRTLEEKVRARTERLESVNRELDEANRLKSEFLATVSHELRTPLNVIMGYASMLAEGAGGAVTGEQQEMLESIHRHSKLQLDLISNVLDFSRLASGRISLHVERFALAPVIEEIRALHVGRHSGPEVAFILDVDAGVPEMETDRVKLQEVIRNLVDNAAKFTHRGSVVIEARAGKRPGWVGIAVRDTGRGISAEDLPRIFEEFRQVGEGMTRTTGGVGLGLAIVRRLVAVLGGSISVESRLGEGSTFFVEVPSRLPTNPPGDRTAGIAAGRPPC